MRCDSVCYGMQGRMKSATPVGYATFFSRSHDAVIRVFNEVGKVIETHEQAGRFQRVVNFCPNRLCDLRLGPTAGLPFCCVFT